MLNAHSIQSTVTISVATVQLTDGVLIRSPQYVSFDKMFHLLSCQQNGCSKDVCMLLQVFLSIHHLEDVTYPFEQSYFCQAVCTAWQIRAVIQYVCRSCAPQFTFASSQ